MGTENKNFNVDVLLREALESSQKPDAALVHELKNHFIEERFTMENKKTVRPSRIIAAALIGVLTLTAIAFAAPTIWRHLDTRVIEGEDYMSNFEMKVSDDGTTVVMGAEFHAGPLDGGLVKVEADGEYMVLADPISFDSIDEAANLSTLAHVLTPTYLPEGFAFERAGFPINPTNHPDHPIAAGHIVAIYSNNDENITLQIMQWDSDWGISFFSAAQVDVTINGNVGAVADGMLMVIIDDVKYSISASSALNLTQAELVRIAESLR